MNQVPNPLTHLDPATLTLAQAQARAAGIGVADHLRRLIHAETLPRDPATGMADIPASYTPPPSIGAMFSVVPPTDPGAPDTTNPTLRHISRVASCLDLAALLLSAALHEGAVTNFIPPHSRAAKPGTPGTWYAGVVDQSITRARQIQAALLHPREAGDAADRLAMQAFRLLAELTPAGSELLRISQYDRLKAFTEMARHVGLIADQIGHAVRLLGETKSAVPPPAPDEQFAHLRAELLEKAGGGLTLTEAAALLGMSRQAVHKRIKAGTVLAMMNGAELVLPRGQFTPAGIVPGLSAVLAPFKVAGAWSALQFLVEPDPNLAGIPLRALTEGRIAAVVDAAKAYLGIDQD